MSFGAIGGAVASTVIGGALSSGGSSPAQAAVSGTDPFSTQTGQFGTAFDADNNFTSTMSPEMQAAQQQALSNANFFGNQVQNNPNAQAAGQQGLGFLQGLQQDPFQAQQQLFNQQNQLLMPQQQQQRLDQEGRLFAQGRLGGTAGANQQNALLDAQAQQTQGLFNNSFGQAQQQQMQQAQLGSQLSQLQPQLGGLFGNVQTGQLGNSLAIDSQQLAQGQLGQSLGSGSVGGTPASTSSSGALGQGLLAGGATNLADQFGGLFQNVPTPSSGVAPVSGSTFSQSPLFQNGFVGGF